MLTSREQSRNAERCPSLFTLEMERLPRLLPTVTQLWMNNLLDKQIPAHVTLRCQHPGENHPVQPTYTIQPTPQHALEAFDAGAVDYLLKPVRLERLAAAVAKVRPLLVRSPKAEDKGTAPARRIVGRHGSDMHLLEPADVVAFEADGETVFIITAGGGRYYAEHSLKALEARLDPRFRRVHRKTIINTDHIRKISPLSSKRWLLKMSNGMEVVVAKRLAGLIREETRW